MELKNSPQTTGNPPTLFTEDGGQLVEKEEYALSTMDLHSEDAWVLDSGATRHMRAYKSLFSNLRPHKTVLNWGKATVIPANWVGTVHVIFGSTGRTAKIENCLYVPEMGLNLLSLGLLRQKGVSINIGLNSVSLVYRGKVTWSSWPDTVRPTLSHDLELHCDRGQRATDT
jgi:hypothetical protein